MDLRYPCLVLDHDDTVVDSAREVNYPNMVKSLAVLRPGMTLSFDEFLMGNFDPGFYHWVVDILHYTREEVDWQYKFWYENVIHNRPHMVPGMKEFLLRYKNAGGIICVATHGMRAMVEEDYRLNCPFLPDYINSWEDPEEHRKPSPYPVQEAIRRFGLAPKDVLVVDDMMPGHLMAEAAGVDMAAAQWCYRLAPVEDYMRKHAQYCLDTVAQLEELIFGAAPKGD